MKKPSTYYFASVLTMNILLGSGILAIRPGMCDVYEELFGGCPLSMPTQFALGCWWWPFAVAAASGIGLILSLSRRFQSHVLCHGVIALLLVDIALLTYTATGFLWGFLQGVETLGP